MPGPSQPPGTPGTPSPSDAPVPDPGPLRQPTAQGIPIQVPGAGALDEGTPRIISTPVRFPQSAVLVENAKTGLQIIVPAALAAGLVGLAVGGAGGLVAVAGGTAVRVAPALFAAVAAGSASAGGADLSGIGSDGHTERTRFLAAPSGPAGGGGPPSPSVALQTSPVQMQAALTASLPGPSPALPLPPASPPASSSTSSTRPSTQEIRRLFG